MKAKKTIQAKPKSYTPNNTQTKEEKTILRQKKKKWNGGEKRFIAALGSTLPQPEAESPHHHSHQRNTACQH